MQHVASKSSVHHSQQHAVDPRGRAPAGEPKQPTTPFSLLLGGAEDAPPPRQKQQDDATKPPSRAAASEASRSDQTQQHPEHEPEAKAAGDAKVTPDETGKTGEKSADAVVATSPEDDETRTADTDKTAAIVAPAAPLPAQQATAAVVAVLSTTQSAPAEPNDDDTADAADLAKAAAAAGLKAEQPTPPKGETDQKAPTAPSSADDSQPVAAAPADGKTAPLEAPKPQEEAHAPSATPDPDKPEHARVHEAASRGEVRSTDELANPQTTTHVADGAPAGKQADGTQAVNVQHQAGRTGNAAAPAAAGPNNTPATVPLAGLALEIAARAQSGRNHFEIRLDPPELGRIHVHLDVDKSGQVTSRLVVDRAETLDALRRDAADLERALQQAGLKTGDSGLQFTLRDQSFAGRDDNSTPANAARLVVPDADLASVEAAPAGYGRLLRAASGVDIRV